jgi:hypothetical protein
MELVSVAHSGFVPGLRHHPRLAPWGCSLSPLRG